jgi:lipid-binding SYLF domain-containing protein
VKKLWYILAAAFLIAYPFTTSSAQRRENERLENAGTVLEDILNVPDDIPSDLLDKAECVIVVPSVLKFAIGFGGSYGRGAMSCRSGANFTGPWGAPTLIAVEGGSFGLQLGGQATDFILLVMNTRGAESILRSKVKLGADAAAAAGPKGRNAQAATDLAMRAEILTYSRSRGLFAGVSLEGSTLRPDNGANEEVYGRKITATEIVREGAVQVPASANKLVSLLNTQSPNNTSDPASLR